jgi:hypothetical protein
VFLLDEQALAPIEQLDGAVVRISSRLKLELGPSSCTVSSRCLPVQALSRMTSQRLRQLEPSAPAERLGGMLLSRASHSSRWGAEDSRGTQRAPRIFDGHGSQRPWRDEGWTLERQVSVGIKGVGRGCHVARVARPLA